MSRRRLLVLASLALALGLFVGLDLGRFLSLDFLKQSHAQLLALYDAHPLQTLAVFFGLYVLATAVSIPAAGTVLTLAAGALFGLWVGLVVVSFASTLGALLAMLSARHLVRDLVAARLGQRLAAIDAGFTREGAWYLLTLRLVPLFPYFVVNLLMGLTSIRSRTFWWASQLGMLPGTLVYVNAGTQLAALESLRGILSPPLLGSLLLLGLFPLLARWALGAWQRRRVLAPWAARRPRRFDRNLVVIGAGAAGLVTSYIAAAVKARVTLVEAHRMGGDCLNTGCVPSKALLHVARQVHQMRQAAALGVQAGPVQIDFARVMQHVAAAVRQIAPNDSIERYTALGVDVQTGHAHIVDPWHVQITHPDGSQQLLSTRSIVIATGAAPVLPNLPGLQEVGALTSDTLWNLQALPRRLVVMGGGPIGCEMAQAFARLGARVTLLEQGPRLLPREDEDVSAAVQHALAADGVEVRTGCTALRCWLQPGPAGARVDAAAEAAAAAGATPPAPTRHIAVQGPAGEEHWVFDALLCAVGRAARLQGFGLEALGIETGRTVVTDAFLRTRFPHILAAGDVAGPWQLTHAASHQAWHAAVNALFGDIKRFKVDGRVMPAATYVDPEVARVGLNEQEARASGQPYELTRVPLHEMDRAVTEDARVGWVKVLTVPGRDTVLGVTIVGPQAGELIAVHALAMRHGLGLNKILSTVHAYPTLAELNKAAAGAWRRAHQPQALLRWVERFHAWRRG